MFARVGIGVTKFCAGKTSAILAWFFPNFRAETAIPPPELFLFWPPKNQLWGGGYNFKTSASKYSSWDIDIIQAMPHPPFGAKDVC